MRKPITVYYGPGDQPRAWSDQQLALHKGKKFVRINLTLKTFEFHPTGLQILKDLQSPTSLAIFHVDKGNIDALLKLLTNHGRITIGKLSAHVIVSTTDLQSELDLVDKIGHLDYVHTYSCHLANQEL